MNGNQSTGARLYAEDLTEIIGVTQELGRYNLTEEAIRAFAQQWDPLAIHVGDGEHFGGVIASGLHTLCVFQRLAVAGVYSRWAVVAGRDVRGMTLPKPVHPGDTLTGRVTIAEVAPARGGRAKVRVQGELSNQHDERVMIIELDGYVHCRGNAAAPAAPTTSGVEDSQV
ncbi:MaoC/PaaZ C-terminal domain-containing protein [Nocardia sp. NPDC059091]|uniref:MaoC/PaaZ C-terminal domain-containing protein n=1 Tax=unclassified Nocardia TaxID=2637762 RepID=UPI00367D8411